MELSREGAMELIGHEGIVLTRYRDSVGVWTIGVGHTKAAGGVDPETFLGELSLKQVFDLFQKDVQKYAHGVNAALKVKVTQTQFDALVSFHFNTGAITRASLVKKLNAGDVAGAAAGFMAWNQPPEVVGRRTKEQHLFAAGKYSNGGMANIFPANPAGHVNFGKPKRIDLRAALGAPVPPPPDISKSKPLPKPDTAKKIGLGVGAIAAAWAAVHAYAQSHPIIIGGGVALLILGFLGYLLTRKKA